MACGAEKRRVSFHELVTVVRIPRSGESEDSRPRVPCLAETLRSAARTMNSLDRELSVLRGAATSGVDAQRGIIGSQTRPIARSIAADPAVQHVQMNVPVCRLRHDGPSIRDSVALDFVRSIVDGVSSKRGTGGPVSVGNTLHVLVDPDGEDLARGRMEHCLVLNTTRRRGDTTSATSPAFRVVLDSNVDA